MDEHEVAFVAEHGERRSHLAVAQEFSGFSDDGVLVGLADEDLRNGHAEQVAGFGRRCHVAHQRRVHTEVVGDHGPVALPERC